MTDSVQIEYPAIVVNVQEPDKKLRVQVRVLGFFDGWSDIDLPWATYKSEPGGGVNRGSFSPCKEGDYVWVDFPFVSHGEADTRKPRITGSMHHSIDGNPNLPVEALGKGRKHKKSTFQSKYHESKVVGFNDCVLEMMPGGTFRIFSGKSGAMVEVDGSGKALIYGATDIEISADGSIDMNAQDDISIKAGGHVGINGQRIDLN